MIEMKKERNTWFKYAIITKGGAEVFDYRRIQQLANTSTLDARENYAEHRAQTMQRVNDSLKYLEQSPQNILIVGAGNGNDLELEQLQIIFPEVWLTDIDERTLKQTLQKNPQLDRLRIWIGDAGGQVELLDNFRFRAKQNPESVETLLTELAAKLEQVTEELCFSENQNTGPKFDIILSQCVLSQILWPLNETVWEITQIAWKEGQRQLAEKSNIPPFPQLATALIFLSISHLCWLARQLVNNGVIIVNTDISWQGTPLYGTRNDDWLRHPSNAWEFLNKTDLRHFGKTRIWPWSLDNEKTAIVESILFRKFP